MQTKDVVKMLTDAGVMWTTDSGTVEPNEDDLQLILDKMGLMLYGEPVGTQLTVAGLMMERRPLGHDLYVFAGNYE
jgi:hypothetical protein